MQGCMGQRSPGPERQIQLDLSQLFSYCVTFSSCINVMKLIVSFIKKGSILSIAIIIIIM